jgi:hypothetical protein
MEQRTTRDFNNNVEISDGPITQQVKVLINKTDLAVADGDYNKAADFLIQAAGVIEHCVSC